MLVKLKLRSRSVPLWGGGGLAQAQLQPTDRRVLADIGLEYGWEPRWGISLRDSAGAVREGLPRPCHNLYPRVTSTSMFKRLFLVFCCYQLGLAAQAADDEEFTLIPSAPEYVASLSGSPTSLIAGKVSPVTGSLLVTELDVVARGAQPIEIHRYFCSGLSPAYPNINPNRADYLAHKDAPVLGGWSFLKHRYLNAQRDDSGRTIITLSQPNGLTLNYQVEPSGETKLISRPVGLHNLGPDGPSGRYHLRNTRFEISPSLKTITAYLPDGVTRTYVYLRGCTFCLQSETLARGNRCATHRWIDDSAISTDSYEYDCFDRLIRSVDPLGNVTTISYSEDSVNNITGLRQRTKTTRHPTERIETVTYNAYDRPVRLQLSDPEGRSLKTSSFTYDLSLNLVQKRDQDRLTTWTYDYEGRPITETLAANCPLAATTTFKYTHSGKLASKVKPSGEATLYDYDDLDNLIGLKGPALSYLYEYDSLGSLIRATDVLNGSGIIRTVDPSGNVTCERLASGKVIRKSYDHADRPFSLTLPDRSEVRFSYDPLHLRSISRHDANGVHRHSHEYQEYNLLGLVTSETAADGSHTSYTYDLKGRLTSKSNPALSITVNNYTADDCPCDVTEDGNEIRLGYDALCQLTKEPEHSHEFSPLYNPVSEDGQTADVNDQDQLVSLGGIQSSYDADGRLVHKHGADSDLAFTYDSLDRLVTVEAPNLKVAFTYDALGRRTTKTVEDRRGWIGAANYHESYLYDGDQEIGTISEDGQIKQLRIGLGGRPSVAIELNGTAYSPFSDLRGNVRTLTAIETGEIADSYQYTAFGPTGPLPSHSNPWRFAGKRTDDELGLVYFGKRYYDPQLARWLTPDPVGILKAHNLYAYCLNNPWRYCDPEGDFVFILAIPLGAAAWSAIATTSVYATAAALVAWGVYETNQYIDRRASHQAFVNTINATYASQNYYNSTTEPKRDKKRRGGVFPDRPLPLDEHGVPIPDTETPHTQLGTRQGSKGPYPQAREFDAEGQAVRDIHFTDHGRPHNHTNPHQHVLQENQTGGTPKRGPPTPLHGSQ
jgi:RHS repeat-associated protein